MKSYTKAKTKAKARDSCSASYRETWQAALYNHRKWQLIGKSQ